MRCTHECPQLNTLLDRNREHEDPREPTDETHRGLGFLNSISEVVKEDMTSEEESSSEDSSSEVSETSTTSSDEDVGKEKPVYVFSCTDNLSWLVGAKCGNSLSNWLGAMRDTFSVCRVSPS